jgi:hypothetical protein
MGPFSKGAAGDLAKSSNLCVRVRLLLIDLWLIEWFDLAIEFSLCHLAQQPIAFPKISLAQRILVAMRPACAFNAAEGSLGLCAASNIMMASVSWASSSSAAMPVSQHHRGKLTELNSPRRLWPPAAISPDPLWILSASESSQFKVLSRADGRP